MRLTDIPGDIDQHVIAPRGREIEVDAKKPGFIPQREVALFAEFRLQRRPRILPRLDSAAREVPPGNIGVPNKKDAPCLIERDDTNA